MSFTFNRDNGKVTVEKSDKKMSLFGGLVAFVLFLSHLGVIDRLVQTCLLTRTSPNATPVLT